MRIQHNIPALNTYRQMGINNSGTAKALEKLSSGYKINRAGDDAAGLAISEKMRAQVRGLNRASSNAQDGISLIQAAEGALQESQNILQRMRELAVQGANDVNTAEDRQAIQDEINQLIREVDRISATTEFNKMTVLDGSLTSDKYGKIISGSNVSSISLITPSGTDPLVNGMVAVSVSQKGTNYDMSFDFGLKNTNNTSSDKVIDGVVQEPAAGETLTSITITFSQDMLLSAGLDASSDSSIKVAVSAGDTGNTIAGNVMEVLQKRLGSDWTVSVTGSKVIVQSKYIGEYKDGIKLDDIDPDIFVNDLSAIGNGIEGTEGQDAKIQIDGADATLVNANGIGWNNDADVTAGIIRGRDSLLQYYTGSGDGTTTATQVSFKVDDFTKASTAIVAAMDGSSLTMQVGANSGSAQTMQVAIGNMNAKSLSVSEISVSSHKEAQNAITSVDAGLQRISNTRSALGSIQNRLEHTIANLDTVAENLQEAESRIRDTDIAKEMMNFTKYSILLQASQAMLAQANNLPQGVLQLLR